MLLPSVTAHGQEQPHDETTTTATTASAAAVPVPIGPPLDCSISTEMELGTTGPDVLCVELALVALGYQLDAAPDEVFDESSVQALMAFQTAGGLVADGLVGPTTGERLEIWETPPSTSSAPATTAPTTTIAPTTTSATTAPTTTTTTAMAAPPSTTAAAPVPTVAPAPPAPAATAATATATAASSSAVGCTITTTVLLGTTGDDTRCVELALSSLGFTNVTVDGSFSAIDRDNPMWFQGSNGLTPDGAATAARLGVWGDPPPSTAVSCPITAAVQLGSTGPAAAYVEQALFNRGFSRALQRVWAVDAGSANPDIKFRYMVRFAYGPNGGRIGFHEIPTKYGVPIQSDSQLGQPLSGGCVRQATADAQWMWNWAGIGTKVVVL